MYGGDRGERERSKRENLKKRQAMEVQENINASTKMILRRESKRERARGGERELPDHPIYQKELNPIPSKRSKP